jgi:hypothetical protein
MHEASHVVLGAYVGATDMPALLHFGQPRCNFSHYLAFPGLVMSYSGYAGDRLLSKLPEWDCVRRTTSDREIRQIIWDDMPTPALDASVCAEADARAFELVLGFPNEIGKLAAGGNQWTSCKRLGLYKGSTKPRENDKTGETTTLTYALGQAAPILDQWLVKPFHSEHARRGPRHQCGGRIDAHCR